jgi:hypothetical protein
MAEGQKPDKIRARERNLWMGKAVGGLILTGAGLSLCIDAGFLRFRGEPWFVYGTAALVVFQTGLCLMIDSLRHRLRQDDWD